MGWQLIILAFLIVALSLAGGFAALAYHDVHRWYNRIRPYQTYKFRFTGMSISKYYLLQIHFMSTTVQHGQTFHAPVRWSMKPWREVGEWRTICGP